MKRFTSISSKKHKNLNYNLRLLGYTDFDELKIKIDNAK